MNFRRTGPNVRGGANVEGNGIQFRTIAGARGRDRRRKPGGPDDRKPAWLGGHPSCRSRAAYRNQGAPDRADQGRGDRRTAFVGESARDAEVLIAEDGMHLTLPVASTPSQ